MRGIIQAFSVIMLVVAWLGHALVYADGTPDGKKSLGGSGEMIQLELPPENRMLAGIEVHGSRYGTANPPNEQFLIFSAGRTKGAYVSYDADSGGERSRVGLPGMEANKPDFTGDWMIRPILLR